MENPFHGRALALEGPATDILPVTPDDDADLPMVATALYVEGAGSITLITVAGQTRTVGVAENSFLPLGVRRVLSGGTTATGIHALVVA